MVLITSIAFDLSFPKLCEIQRSDAKWQLGQPTDSAKEVLGSTFA